MRKTDSSLDMNSKRLYESPMMITCALHGHCPLLTDSSESLEIPVEDEWPDEMTQPW